MKLVVMSFDNYGNITETLLDSKDLVISLLLDENERELIHNTEPNKIITFFPNREEFINLENRTKVHNSLTRRIRTAIEVENG